MKKVTTLILLFSCICFGLKAQEPMQHVKKVYVSPEGKIYINKALPVYLRISASPEKQDKSYLLNSETTPGYANPMYLDQEGYNSIRSPWAVDTVTKETVFPKQDIVYEVYADSKPPSTSLAYNTKETFKRSGKTYIKGTAEVSLNAVDEISGVENIYYSMDGASYTVFSAPLNLQQEREYTIRYYAADHVGNAETPREISIVLDLSAPLTLLEITGDRFENVISGRSKIVLKAEDKGMGTDKIFFRTDSTDWRNYQLPLSGSAVAQGEHTLSYYAVDLTGNRETEKTFAFYVDKTPPVMVQELIGQSFSAGGKEYASGKNQIKITAFDNKAGIKEVFYSVNDADYVRYEKPFYLADVKGDLLLKAYAVDNVGNRTESLEKGEAFTIPYIDLSGPTLNHSFTGPTFKMRDTVFINAKTGILLKASDSESGVNRVEYAVDGSTPTPYRLAFRLENEGRHKIRATGYDNVENTSYTEFDVITDNTGPAVSVHFSIRPVDKRIIEGNTLEVYPGHTVVFLSCTDDRTGYDALYYSLNGAPEKKYLAPIGSFTAGGNYNLNIRAVDKLGNETHQHITFIIEI